MRSIGITGGIGAGKSEIIKYIANRQDVVFIIADKLAYELESPGNECYDRIVRALGEEVLDSNGEINKKKMAAAIFSDSSLLETVNSIIHPAVKEHIIKRMNESRNMGMKFFFVEAALLIEEGYETILDELWYIRADEDIRRDRLKKSRGYSDEKIDSIFENQLDDEEFIKHCKVIIDNSGELSETYKQIDEALK